MNKVDLLPPRLFRMLVVAGLVAIFSAGAAFGAYFSRGASLMHVTMSPDGRERVESYYPTRWQRLTGPNADLPGFVRLTDVANNEVLGTSEVFEMSGMGPPFWVSDKQPTRHDVQVNAAAWFNRRQGRWFVQKF